MRVGLIALAVIAATVGPASARSGVDRCVRSGERIASPPVQPFRARPLGEMPPARAVLAVDRRVDGCPVLLIREGGRIVEEPVGDLGRRRTFTP